MIRLAALLLAATATTLPAQEAPPARAEGGIRAEAMRAHVAFLADDLLEGRDAGTRGYDIAARYVATQFDALGLKPGVDGGWYQMVSFQKARLDPAKPAVLTIGAKKFDSGGDIAIAPDGRFQDQVIDAGVVFVGYGLDAPAHGFDDYKGLDVAGKFVVMLPGVPEGTPSEVGASLGSDKARMAAARGAISVITMPTPTMLKQFPWERARAMIGTSRQRVMEPDGKPRLSAPGIRASAYVHGPAAEALFAGSGTTPGAVFAEAAKKGARPRGMALKQRLGFTQSSIVDVSRSPNVIGVLPGSDATLAAEYVLLTAHLDHNGVRAEAPGTDKIFNGAMDNAAGVATMIEAARAFVASGRRPRRSVMFVALTSEEDGLLGSDYLARHPVVPAGGRVVANVNLDMPVLLYKLDDVVAFGAEHSTVGEAVARAAVKAGITLSPDFMPEENVFVRSDHYSFVKQGVPSVMLATGSKNDGARIFRDFLATKYHTPADQIDLPFDWASAAKFADVNYLVARDLADAASAPRWYADSPFAAQFAKDQPKATRRAK
jgi:Zn-dependent M28 family amino/carboxypeptidase